MSYQRVLCTPRRKRNCYSLTSSLSSPLLSSLPPSYPSSLTPLQPTLLSPLPSSPLSPPLLLLFPPPLPSSPLPSSPPPSPLPSSSLLPPLPFPPPSFPFPLLSSPLSPLLSPLPSSPLPSPQPRTYSTSSALGLTRLGPKITARLWGDILLMPPFWLTLHREQAASGVRRNSETEGGHVTVNTQIHTGVPHADHANVNS